jgi:hypothetical protein
MTADIITAMRDRETFGAWFQGQSWSAWQVALKGAFGHPMTDDERDFFREIAEREPPTKQVKEFWAVVGRGDGKDSVASFVTAYIASSFARPKPEGTWGRLTSSLRRGERAMVACLACSRDQARIALDMTKAFFDEIPALKKMIVRETRDGFQLSNGVDIVVATNDYRSIRGRGVLAVVLDEVAFFRDDNSANPDEELYRGLLPALARVPGSLLIGISSAYKKSGLLWRKFDEGFGKENDTVLVIRAPTMVMNPSINPAEIERAMLEDPVGGRAEWLSEFREDIAGFVSHEVVNRCTSFGITERPALEGMSYSLFFDIAQGGSGGDSAAVSVAHKDHERNKLVQDYLLELKAPFSPSAFIEAVCNVADRYGISDCYGDGVAKGMVAERLRERNKRYREAPLTKSGIYGEILGWLNSSSVDFLDSQRLRSQLLSLDRRPGANGRDIIEHPRRANARDDVCNAACGALMLCAAAARRSRVNAVGVSMFGSSPEIGGVVRDGKYIPAGREPHISAAAPGYAPEESLHDEVPNTGSSLGLGYDPVRGWHKPDIDPRSR